MGGAFSRLSKEVEWKPGYKPAPPTVAQVERAIADDNRKQILDWWRHCGKGTITGEIGTAMTHAMKVIEKRCSEDDAKELINAHVSVSARTGRAVVSEGREPQSAVRAGGVGSNNCMRCGELG